MNRRSPGLFKEFVRIKNNRTKGIAGSGLGLSIVQKIAELYGGHIQVESEPEKGSEFRVILPATIEPGRFTGICIGLIW